MTGVASSRQVGNLPVDVVSFVDRRSEVAEVKSLLSSSRLVTLTGIGGVGKTQLALHVAGQLHRVFAGGVWFVGLGELTKADLVPLTVMQAMGWRNPAGSDTAALISYLQDKQLLVVLDNCEHLVSACARLVDALLSHAPGMRILATSREPLVVAGEHTFIVPPLPVPETDEVGAATAKDGASSAAMTLFEQRAGAVLSGFSVTKENRAAVARLCRRLDGLPLAIEIAAVRMRALSIEDILERLDKQSQLLTTGSRTAAPRHKTLDSTFSWSFDLCSPQERELWEGLSVFPGTFDLADVEGVCCDDRIPRDDVLDPLAGLINKSIVLRTEHNHPTRYQMLKTVRQYGQEQLVKRGGEARLRRRYRDYYVHLAEQADAAWFGPDQVEWSTRTRLELPNFRAALDYCFTAPGQAGIGLRTAEALWFYWTACHYPREGRHWLDRALALNTEPTRERAKALWVNGYFAVRQGDLRSAHALLDECRKLAEQIGDEHSLAAAIQMSGLAGINGNDLPAAIVLLEEAVRRHHALSKPDILAVFAQYLLALAHCLTGDTDRAIALADGCRAICESHGERWCRSYALWVLGLAHRAQGDLRQASAYVRECLTFKHELHDLLGLALAVDTLAWIMAEGDEPEYAARLLGASEQLWRPVGAMLLGSRIYQGFHDTAVHRAQVALGESKYQACLRQGGELDVDEIVALARGKAAEPRPAAEAAPVSKQGVTTRERQVAELIAQGLSNKEIADKLVISRRTVDAHVEHILTKLGFRSRMQIAAWIHEQQQGSQMLDRRAAKRNGDGQ